MKILFATVCAGFALLLAGCGVQGAPQPPTLDLPKPPSDLRAVRKGDKVTLAWTQPSLNTDGIAVKHLGETNVCRTIANSLQPPTASTCSAIGKVAAQPTASNKNPGSVTATYSDTLSSTAEQADPTGAAGYAVEALNTRGRGAGLSNSVTVPLAPTLAPPTDVKVSVAADGIHVSAQAAQAPAATASLKFTNRVLRIGVPAAPNETPALVAEIPANEPIDLVDVNFEWEKTYSYRITPMTTVMNGAGQPAASVEGDDSQAVQVFAHDIFPPAVPSGLQAAYSGLEAQKFIDLTWNINTDADLGGYNVYRHEAGEPARKINTALLKTPAFRDSDVQGGHTYFYSVSAVDVRGNESARSQETSESVPAQ